MREQVPPRTIRQAADDMNVSVHTVRAWIHQRKLGYVRLGRAIRIPVHEIQRIVERGTVPPIGE